MNKNLETIEKIYSEMGEKIKKTRDLLQRPLTLTEKILYSHLAQPLEKPYLRGKSYVNFNPDRVILQDATAQMAILQFMQAGKKNTAVPTSVHCDHLIQAKIGAVEDLKTAQDNNKEVYDFLANASKKYKMDFWKPGAGIIHQVALENYAFPGGLMIGTDSHTPNAGGLGMLAIGVGGADAVDVMVGMAWELLFPKVIGVKLTGKLSGWTSAKDIILKVAGITTVKGGTGAIIEYFGEGAQSLSSTGKATICNMGAEIGSTTSTFSYDDKMGDYLRKTARGGIADLADNYREHLNEDPEVYDNPKYFDQLIEIDLNILEPHINGPFTPDRAIPISKFKEEVVNNNWPKKLDVGLIGSCTNSSYEDISRSASIAKQAATKNLKTKSEFTITPGSEQVRYTVERDGYLNDFKKIGGLILANACGPCIGQWARHNQNPDEKNSIITSFNRNFAKRNDGNPNTHAFVASPEIVTALTIAGDLTFNPLTDSLTNENKETVKLDEPQGIELPPQGFAIEDVGLIEDSKNSENVDISIDENSERLQLLQPFTPFGKEDLKGLKLLIKARGKCTTDHISMAGPWLKYRGHLDNISNNLLIGAINYFNGKVNSVKNQLNGEYGEVPTVQRNYKKNNQGTIIVGDENYGEGSSREHAAMEPRHLGVRVVLVKSFARIHETNLKKQGILALTFSNPNDYEKVKEDDSIDILGWQDFTPETKLEVILNHKDGSIDSIKVNHTYNKSQISWFEKGSALNLIKFLN